MAIAFNMRAILLLALHLGSCMCVLADAASDSDSAASELAATAALISSTASFGPGDQLLSSSTLIGDSYVEFASRSSSAADVETIFGSHSSMYAVSRLTSNSTDIIIAEMSLDCADTQLEYSQVDGRCNNLLGHPEFGMVGAPYLRLVSPTFPGNGSGATMSLPVINARLVSNIVFEQASIGDRLDERNLSNWVVDFGQFVNHDRQLNTGSGGILHPVESVPIVLPADEAIFVRPIAFTRAEFSTGSGTSRRNPRVSVNMGTTAWLDASALYGATAVITQLLRGDHGLMKSQMIEGQEFPPFLIDVPLPGAFAGKDTLLSFGDNRGNEQLGLSVIQTIWLREHNRVARELFAASPAATSDTLFLRARSFVIAEFQKTTVDYFAALGVPVTEYAGYTGRDPSAYSEFIAAAMRVGHSQIYNSLERKGPDRRSCCGGGVPLADGFFSPELMFNASTGLDSFVRGFSYTAAQAVDAYSVDGVRNLLFGAGAGLDLLAIDVQREADQGLATFARMRQVLGLPPIKTLEQLTDDDITRTRIRRAYTVNGRTPTDAQILSEIDLFTGGLAERHPPTASLGPTFSALFSITLNQIRSSDRFWFERVGSLSTNGTEDARLRQIVFDTDFGDILARNTRVPRAELQRNVFFTPTATAQQLTAAISPSGPTVTPPAVAAAAVTTATTTTATPPPTPTTGVTTPIGTVTAPAGGGGPTPTPTLSTAPASSAAVPPGSADGDPTASPAAAGPTATPPTMA